MRVYGQLEFAQLEQVNGLGALLGPATAGRVVQDISGARAQPYFYDTVAWRQLLLSPILFSQSGSGAITIDWSKGLYQQFILTGHTIFSFINPVAGAVHTLIVTQQQLYNGAALKTPFRFVFNQNDMDPQRQPYQIPSVIQTDESQTFQWLYQAGVKPAYATVPAAAGASLNASVVSSISFASDGSFWVGLGSGGIQRFNTVDAGPGLRWGTTNINDSNTGSTANALIYSPNLEAVFYAITTTPFIAAVTYNKLSGTLTGTAYSNPASLPSGVGTSIACNPSGTVVAMGHSTTPFLSVYPITSQGFGAVYANPATLPANTVYSLAFSELGDYLAVVSQTSPFLQVYPFDQVTGFGTVVPNPSPLPAGSISSTAAHSVAWRPQGDFIAVAMTTTPFLYVVPFNRNTSAYGTPLAVTALSAACTGVAWSKCGTYLFATTGTTPFLYVYDFSAQNLSTLLTFDSAGPGSACADVAVAPNNEYFMVTTNSAPYVAQFPMPRKVKNWLRLK